MKDKTIKGFVVASPKLPNAEILEFFDVRKNPEAAWKAFCGMALKKSAFEEEGYRAVPVTITLHFKDAQ